MIRKLIEVVELVIKILFMVFLLLVLLFGKINYRGVFVKPTDTSPKVWLYPDPNVERKT